MFKPLLRHTGTAALCAALLAASCIASAAELKSGLKIAFVPKQINNPYEVIADDGGMAAIKEFGGVGKVVGPSDAGASSQVQYINTLITQRQDAIVIAANDANAVVPYLKKAMGQGIKVVTFDSDAPTCRSMFINQATPQALGDSEVDLLASQIGDSGQIAIVSASADDTNQNSWISYMKQELKKFPKMSLVSTVYGNDDTATSTSVTQGLLEQYPNLKGIISPTTVGIAAAAAVLDTAKYRGKVMLTGLGTPDEMKQYVKDGTVKSFELWNPADLGYLAAYAAVELASGSINGAAGQTFTAGKLGKFTVGTDNTVLLGAPYVFSASNINNFNF